MNRPRLNLVNAEDELLGKGPADFERLARSAVPDSADHIGVVAISVSLSTACLKQCLPPSAHQELLESLLVASRWMRNQATVDEVKRARAECFQMVGPLEELTSQAVEKAQEFLKSTTSTPLDPHADHVLLRYARLSAHFTVSSACHTLDAIAEPASALEVLQDVEGARAYQAVGLGAARHAAFRAAAWDQAQWESSRVGRSKGGDGELSSLALQVFHEYLGGRYRKHVDAERARNDAWIAWALSGNKRTTSD